jgi:hypothetical protein
MIDSADSRRDQLGQLYRASIDQPVVANGQVIVPRGADAQVALIARQQSGQIGGRAVLTLDLRSVTIDGQVHDLVSSRVTENSSSRGARSAQVIGGTTALGAIVGAVAGGGRGAAIGAGSGAVLGTDSRFSHRASG